MFGERFERWGRQRLHGRREDIYGGVDRATIGEIEELLASATAGYIENLNEDGSVKVARPRPGPGSGSPTSRKHEETGPER